MSRTVFDLIKLKAEIIGLEGLAKESGFWDNPQEAARVNKSIADKQEEVNFWEHMLREIKELFDILKVSAGDDELKKEIKERVSIIEKKYTAEEFKLFLSGPYDKLGAYLTIYSGAGGLDAQDWANMLLRMYERYFERKGYKAIMHDISYGEEKGIKEATIEVNAPYAYGMLRGESGVHRLVRISPFSSQKLRHTSFALVDILPKIEEAHDIEIKDEDLRIDTYRASGPGGQNVNMRETAVRITHIPTGVTAASQHERSQAVNRERALQLLLSKLYMLKQKEESRELEKLKGDKKSPDWGNQIRSYVLHPYQQVKDHRTDIETSNVDAVLDGDLDMFVDAEIRLIK